MPVKITRWMSPFLIRAAYSETGAKLLDRRRLSDRQLDGTAPSKPVQPGLVPVRATASQNRDASHLGIDVFCRHHSLGPVDAALRAATIASGPRSRLYDLLD